MEFSLEPESVLDPRGVFNKQSVALAPRLASLNGKNILLFNNTQVSTLRPKYGAIFKWLSKSFQASHGINCSYRTQDLLKGSAEELARLADDIAGSDVDGVVVALCHLGITQPTTIFASELERRGKPCVLICTSVGSPLAGITSSNYAPGLPIVVIAPATGPQEAFGVSELAAITTDIESGLLTDAGELVGNFSKRPATAAMGPGEGKIELAPVMLPAREDGGKRVVRLDPGAFVDDVFERLCAADLCDGFPVIPPTETRVEEMLRQSDLDADFVFIDEMPPSGASITLRTLAVNAVMAGCRPEYFPVVVAAMQAVSDPAYRAFQGAISTHPAGNAVVVSGPLAGALGIHSGAGCVGPGFRANATIGRAINLTITNGARAIPGKSDLGVYGSPAEYSYCFAESDQSNPWLPLHAELYGPDVTSVTVHKCEGPHNVLDPRGGPEDLLRTIAAVAATPGGNNHINLEQLLVILNPSQAGMLSRAGWSKRDVREFLFECARHPVEFVAPVADRFSYPPYYLKLDQVPVMRSPDDVILVVCGGGNGHAMVGIPWGRAKAVSRPVSYRDGSPRRP